MEKNQSIDKMANELRCLVGEFVAYWMAERERATNKDEWPKSLPPGEWWEQFVVWAQMHEGKPAIDA